MPQPAPIEYGTLLKEAQARLGWSNERCAAELEISTSTWSGWKRTGLVPPSRVKRVRRVLGVEPPNPPAEAKREWELEETVAEQALKLLELQQEVAELRREDNEFRQETRQEMSEIRDGLFEVRVTLAELLPLQPKTR